MAKMENPPTRERRGDVVVAQEPVMPRPDLLTEHLAFWNSEAKEAIRAGRSQVEVEDGYLGILRYRLTGARSLYKGRPHRRDLIGLRMGQVWSTSAIATSMVLRHGRNIPGPPISPTDQREVCFDSFGEELRWHVTPDSAQILIDDDLLPNGNLDVWYGDPDLPEVYMHGQNPPEASDQFIAKYLGLFGIKFNSNVYVSCTPVLDRRLTVPYDPEVDW